MIHLARKDADFLSELPHRLKALRGQYAWTMDDVARRVGVTQAAVVSNWEATNQRRRIPELATLLVLQRWYGVSMDYLLGLPGADRDSPAVKEGKRRLREELRAQGLEMAAPAQRAQIAIALAAQVAPEAFFSERLAACLQMDHEDFQELYQHGFWVNRLIDQVAEFLGIEREWFYSPEPANVINQSKA